MIIVYFTLHVLVTMTVGAFALAEAARLDVLYENYYRFWVMFGMVLIQIVAGALLLIRTQDGESRSDDYD